MLTHAPWGRLQPQARPGEHLPLALAAKNCTCASPVSPRLPCHLLRPLVSMLHPGGIADQFRESCPRACPVATCHPWHAAPVKPVCPPRSILTYEDTHENYRHNQNSEHIRVVSSKYLRLLLFLLTSLIPACASSSPAFLMMYSAYKLNKQGDNIQP